MKDLLTELEELGYHYNEVAEMDLSQVEAIIESEMVVVDCEMLDNYDYLG